MYNVIIHKLFNDGILGSTGPILQHNGTVTQNQEPHRPDLGQHQQTLVHRERQPSTAEAALISSSMDSTEKYQKISEIGKGKCNLIFRITPNLQLGISHPRKSFPHLFNNK